MVTSLIEDTLGANREGTDRASKFLDERIAEHEARLEQAEQALAEFQRANSGKLPGSEGNYFSRMQRERDDLETVGVGRNDVERADADRPGRPQHRQLLLDRHPPTPGNSQT